MIAHGLWGGTRSPSHLLLLGFVGTIGAGRLRLDPWIPLVNRTPLQRSKNRPAPRQGQQALPIQLHIRSHLWCVSMVLEVDTNYMWNGIAFSDSDA